MNNIIYTYGGGEVLYHVFNAVATILGGGTDSIFEQMLKIAMIIGGFWAIINIITKNNLVHGVTWFAWFLVVSEVMFIPKTSVLIKDPVNRYERFVDNVPFGLALISGFFSQFGQIMTEEMENKFSLPDDLKYHQTGSVFASRLLMSMDKARIVDSDFEMSMHNFVNQCVVIPAMIGRKYTIEDLRTSTDVWALVRDNAPQMIGFSYKDPLKKYDPPQIITCKEGAIELDKHWKDQISKVSMKMAKINLPDFIVSLIANGNIRQDAANVRAKQEFERAFRTTFSEMRFAAQDAETALKQQMTINAIIDGSNKKLERLGGRSNYAESKAILQQQNTYSIMGVLAQSLPLVKTVFEAICYGSFVFIVMIAMFPGGHRVLFNYFGIIAWLQLWAPLNAILNLIITLTAQSRTLSIIGTSGGLTLANSAGVIRMNEDMCSYAMYLSMLVPFIAAAIMKGGVSSFVQLSSHIGSGYQSAAASVASEATSGNISMGNISHNIRSRENMTAFQHMSSPMFNSGQHSTTMEDGTIRTSNPDGSFVYRSGTGQTASSFATNLRATETMSAQWSEQIAQEKSAISSRTKELSDAESITSRQVADFISRASQGTSSGESYDLSKSSSSAKTIQNTLEFSKQLQEQYGYTSSQAASITAGISASGGVGIGADLGLKFTSEAARKQALEEVTSLANRQNFSETTDSITRASKDIKYAENQSEEKSLSEGMSASWEKVQSLREANSISEQNIEKYGNSVSYLKSDGIVVDRDINQRFKDWLATREENGRQIGQDTSVKMINRWGDDVQGYWRHFLNAEREEISAKANPEIQEAKSKVDSGFDKESQNINLSIDKEQIFDQVRTHAKNKDMSAHPVKNSYLKEEVNEIIDNADQKIEERKNQNETIEKEKQEKIDGAYDKDLIGNAAINTVLIPSKN